MVINAVVVIVLLIWVVNVGIGANRGFFRSCILLVSMLCSGIIVMAFNPYVTSFLENNTGIDEWIGAKTETMIEDALGLPEGSASSADSLGSSEISQLLEDLPLPGFVTEVLEENNTSSVYSALGVSSFTEYLKAYISSLCLSIISYLITFIIVFIALHALTIIFDLIDRLPIIHGLNHILGAVIGVVKGYLIVELLFTVLILFAATAIGQTIVSQIYASEFLTVLYDGNILVKALMNLAQSAL